jgi:hypothetical protein
LFSSRSPFAVHGRIVNKKIFRRTYLKYCTPYSFPLYKLKINLRSNF